MDMRAAFGRTAAGLVYEDPRVALVLAEISVSAYFEETIARHPERTVNIGIMEQTMVGVAAGFAMEGFYPIAHSLSPFMSERPYEQLKLDFGYQGLGGTFVGSGGSYDYAAEGATHHAAADATLMLAIPGMEVLVPGHGSEVEALLRATYANDRPTYMRTSMAVNAHGFEVAPGRSEVLRRGASGTLVAFGPMLSRTLEACEGLDVNVLYSTSLRPFDATALASVVDHGTPVITIEPFYEGTAAMVVTEVLAHLPVRFASVGVPRAFIHGYGTWSDLDADVGLDAASVRRRISDAIYPNARNGSAS